MSEKKAEKSRVEITLEQQENELVEQVQNVRKNMIDNGAKIFRDARKAQSSTGDWIRKATEILVDNFLGASSTIATLHKKEQDLMAERAKLTAKQKKEVKP